MKKQNFKSEYLSSKLTEIDGDILNEAYLTDSKDKLEELKASEQKRVRQINFNRPSVRHFAVAAASLVLVFGFTFGIASMMRGSNPSEQPPIPPEFILQPENGAIDINSIDKLNYYSAVRIITEALNNTMKSTADRSFSLLSNGKGSMMLLSNSENIGSNYELPSDEPRSDLSDSVPPPDEPQITVDSEMSNSNPSETKQPNNQNGFIVQYELDPNDIFTVSKVVVFQIELKGEHGFLAAKLGKGIVDVVITDNSLETMITFKRGDRYYSCLSNGMNEFSTHKYIEGFFIVKNFARQNFRFEIDFNGNDVVGFECSYFKNFEGESDFVPDIASVVPDSSAVFYVEDSFTIVELEEYFNAVDKIQTAESSDTDETIEKETTTEAPSTEKIGDDLRYVNGKSEFWLYADGSFEYRYAFENINYEKRGVFDIADGYITLEFVGKDGKKEVYTTGYDEENGFVFDGSRYYLAMPKY